MRALILAAGRGSRMGELCIDSPKCLVDLGGRPLIAWQLDALARAGISEIGVVRGYRAECLDLPGVVGFENPRWATTNMVASLTCARDWLLADDCLVAYADIIYGATTLRPLLALDCAIGIAYDLDWLELWQARFPDPLADAETLRVDAGGTLIEIGQRARTTDEIQGQYLGLLRFSPAGWHAVERLLATLPEPARDRLDMTGLLSRLIGAGEQIRATPIRGGWAEVDSAADLTLYREWLAAGRALVDHGEAGVRALT